MRNCSNSEQFLGLQTGFVGAWTAQSRDGLPSENASIFSWNCFHFPTDWDSDYSGHLHDRALNWHLPLACLPWTWLVNHYFCLTWIESHLILFSRMFLMYEYCRVPLHLVCYWRQWITNWRPTLCVAVSSVLAIEILIVVPFQVWQHCRVIGR